jgi:hypothetical protein
VASQVVLSSIGLVSCVEKFLISDKISETGSDSIFLSQRTLIHEFLKFVLSGNYCYQSSQIYLRHILIQLALNFISILWGITFFEKLYYHWC